jgi:hypothetical protein
VVVAHDGRVVRRLKLAKAGIGISRPSPAGAYLALVFVASIYALPGSRLINPPIQCIPRGQLPRRVIAGLYSVLIKI